MPNITGKPTSAALGPFTSADVKEVPLTTTGALRVFDESGASGGGTGTPAAAADATANPTLGGLLSFIHGFNGATWDRIRTAVTTVSATLTGMLNTLPWALYHSSPVTRTNGQGGPLETNALGALRVEEQNVVGWSFANITAATTTTVKSGAGVLHRIIIGTIVGAATITVYDNTAGSGTKLGILTLPAAGAGDMPDSIEFNCAFATGLTLVTSGATDLTVVYL